MTYYYAKQSKKSFADTEAAVRAALKEQGFGIITEIDAQKTVKEKLGVEMQQYKILGACNPQFAHNAIEAEANIGVLLPCNVLLRQEKDHVVVSAVLPSVQLGKVHNPALHPIALQVEERLKHAVDRATE